MTAQLNRINALISNIDEALSLSNPRPPLVVMGDSIMQSRQVLEQVRSFLLSLEPSSPTDASEIIPRYSDGELQSLEESLRLIVRDELEKVQSQFTQTIQAEIQAMRQERRVLIRELRWLKQQRQQAETRSQTIPQNPASSQSPARESIVFPPTQTYIYPSSKPKTPELFPYAGVELPTSVELEPPPQTQNQESVQPELSQTASNSTTSELETPDPESVDVSIDGSSTSETTSRVVEPKTESVLAEAQISSASQTPETASVVVEEKTFESESAQAEAQISPASEIPQTTPTVVSLNLDPVQEVNPLKTSPVPSEKVNTISGVVQPRPSSLRSQGLPSSRVALTEPPTQPPSTHKRLEQESYVQASPNENLLPHEEDEDDEDLVDSHLMVGKSIKQLLEEDLLNLEQQSFIGEEDPISDISQVNLIPTNDTSDPLENSETVKTFEDLWSEPSFLEDNPFQASDLSEMNLDELLTTVKPDEKKQIDSSPESDLDDFNFEALNRKIQSE
ncbi:MAG: hypothetical protein AAFO04_17515 [Cyanobacteria bacterium J06592_8]